MKTDSIFSRLFQEFPSIFFELIGNPPAAVDNYQFSSVEIKQTAFRIDGVFLATQSDNTPIYFVEVQFQPDPEFYSWFFAEIFLYLRHNKPTNDWRAVVFYPTQSVDIGNIKNYCEFLTSQRISRIYLNELGEAAEQSIGVGTVKLVISPEARVIEQARRLIDRVRQEIADELVKQEHLELIETIIFYKLANMSREEIQAMFGLSELKQTKVYQEALQEGERRANLKAVPRLLALGLSMEQVAEALGLELEEARQAVQNQPSE